MESCILKTMMMLWMQQQMYDKVKKKSGPSVGDQTWFNLLFFSRTRTYILLIKTEPLQQSFCCRESESERSVSALLWHIPSMLGGGGGDGEGERGGGRVTPEWNITLLNLGHHTRALSKRADPWSRDLETERIKVGGNSVARQNYLWTKKQASPAEDDNLHLDFEPSAE